MNPASAGSGFNVFCGLKIQPGDEEAMENLARYIIRAPFSQERMTYISDESKVVYKSKDTKEEKIFDALEWLVPPTGGILTSRTRGNPAGRDYYGYYSPTARGMARGKRKKNDQDELIRSIMEPVEDPVFSGDAYIGDHRGRGGRQKDTQTSRSVGEEGPAATQNQCPTAKCPYR